MMKRFFIKLFLFTLAVAAVDFAWICFAPVQNHVPHVWAILFFFVTVTALFHYFSVRASKEKLQAFVRYYIGTTALRMLLYVMVIIAYRFYDKLTLIPFAIGFMGHYFLYTLFEVHVLLREIKRN
jgi:hypothetical protein